MRGFRWIGRLWKFIVTRSKHYENLAEKLAEARREMKTLEQDWEEERAGYETRLDRANDDVVYAGARYSEARAEKLALESQVVSLEESNTVLNKQILNMRNYAIKGLEGVLETFGQAPGFLVTSDFVPVKANNPACEYFREQIVGKTLQDLGIYDTEASLLKEEILRNGGPFVIGYKDSRLAGWGVIPLMDESKKLLACLFTSEKELIKRITSAQAGFFKSALAVFIGRKQLDEQGLVIGDNLTLVKARG